MATKPQQTVQETSAAFSLDTAARARGRRARRSRSRGGAPGISRGAGCAGTTSRSPSSAIFVLIVVGVLRSRRCTRITSRRPARTTTTSRRTSRSREGKNRSSPRAARSSTRRRTELRVKAGHDPRPDLVAGRRQVRPRRGRQRQGRRGPAPLRRHQLAQGRHRLGADLHPVLASSSRCSPGYYRGSTDWIITRFFDLIWAFPVILLAIALGSALVDQRHQLGADTGLERKPLDPDARHLVRADPVRRAAAARPDPLAAREGVRRGVDRAGREPAARHVRRDPSEHRVERPRLLHADHREQHPHRGRAVVPRRRRAAAESVVGDADRRGPGADHDRAVADARPRASRSCSRCCR